MWSLRDLSYDEAIEGDEVYIFSDDSGELEPMAKAEALAVARSLNQHLVAVRPPGSEQPPVVCALMTLAVPVAWEELLGASMSRETTGIGRFEGHRHR